MSRGSSAPSCRPPTTRSPTRRGWRRWRDACCARGSCRPTWASRAATSASPPPAASASRTNEGNGRLTTSVPRVHVALMGIERIVPTLDDLGVMLQVLGRSATGQKLTVYSNVMSGPRRHGRDGGRRASRRPRPLPRRAGGQRPQHAGRLRARRDPLLHPLRRVPEQLSGLPADGRACVRQHLSRPGWRGADAGAAGPARSGTTCRRPAACAARAARCARSASTSRACCSSIATRRRSWG